MVLQSGLGVVLAAARPWGRTRLVVALALGRRHHTVCPRSQAPYTLARERAYSLRTGWGGGAPRAAHAAGRKASLSRYIYTWYAPRQLPAICNGRQGAHAGCWGQGHRPWGHHPASGISCCAGVWCAVRGACVRSVRVDSRPKQITRRQRSMTSPGLQSVDGIHQGS